MVHLQGLCGTFNQNQNDDFLTPEGDIEQDVVAFANKWKTHEVCEDVPERETPTHPCDVNAHNRATAEKHCSKLKGLLFEGTYVVGKDTVIVFKIIMSVYHYGI